jgi:hypothetical protein
MARWADEAVATALSRPRRIRNVIRDVQRAGWIIGLAVALPVAAVLLATYRTGPALRFAAGAALAAGLQWLVIGALRRHIGPERASPADLVTLLRAALGMLLVGLVASGVADRLGAAGWLAFAAALLGATVTDWLDGPLARRYGPTRLGGALDIETDSWLTLWSAAAAIALGGLALWCLAPPLARCCAVGCPPAVARGGAVSAGSRRWRSSSLHSCPSKFPCAVRRSPSCRCPSAPRS